jgi:transketolase
MIDRGGYILIDCEGEPEAIVIATGSEIGIAAEAVRAQAASGRRLRLVSMPSTTTFDQQDDAYRQSVLPDSVSRRVAVEAGARDTWWKYVGLKGRIIGMETFGHSAPGKALFEYFGFTAANVGKAIDAVLAN